ncbi:MAG: DNA polymerase III subunit gamma/tau [Erysipelotrichales bacterium]|nr:DNA polymerase III subunit gamma/tau [Erysipelotrichales bacterium]
MAYKALYRTYRPSTFEEVAGQRHIVKTLQNAFSTNKIAHAYLFCGPRGTGKTSMAKLVAKALNCEEGIGHQCNHCSNCLAVADGSHPDVIEIDAASNNGVDEVRDLIEKVKYSPIKGRYKVYIIDEVHMMTSGAFNALLKTLEEPPAHVIFILATTDAHKVIPTIVSRCQRYDFSKVDDIDIINRLKTIFALEGIIYDDTALKSIVSLADGGVRDALSIADQVIAYSGNAISEKDVEDLFGLASIEEKINFILEINRGNTKYVLEKMNQFIESGIDIKRLTNDMLDILKDVMIMSDTGEEKLLLKLRKEQALDLVDEIDNTVALEMIKILLEAQSEYRFVNNISSLFQVTLLKMLNAKKAQNPIIQEKVVIKEVIKETKPIEEEKIVENVIEQEKTVEQTKPVESINESHVSQKEENVEVGTTSYDDSAIPLLNSLVNSGDKNILPEETIIKLMIIGDKEARLAMVEKWKNLDAYKMHPSIGTHATLLANGRPYIMNSKLLILLYQFAHDAERVNFVDNQKSLTSMIKMISGTDIKVYAISQNESLEAQRKYMQLRQISKLPHVTLDDIEIDIKGE